MRVAPQAMDPPIAGRRLLRRFLRISGGGLIVTDLQLERERRAQHRFKDTTRQAMLHADDTGRLHILRVLDAVDAGIMAREDAHEAFRDLQRSQQAA